MAIIFSPARRDLHFKKGPTVSEFYSFSGSYVRLAGNSPTELSSSTAYLQAKPRDAKFSYTIEQTASGELPVVDIDEKFIDSYIDAGGLGLFDPVLRSQPKNSDPSFDARVGQIDWGNGQSSTVLSFQLTSGVISVEHYVTLAGDPLPVFGSTGALEYNAFLQSVTFVGEASGQYGPGKTIRLTDLELVTNADPLGIVDSGGTGPDTLSGSIGMDTLRGNDGNDTIKGLASADKILAGRGDDKVNGGRGDDNISGGAGKDNLKGGAGADRLSGGTGRDDIAGGGGTDVLIGGKGSDVFHFSDKGGKDVVRDFDTSRRGDMIDLSEVSKIKSFRDLKANHMSDNGTKTTISDDNGTKIILNGITVGELGSGDFIF